MEVDAIEVHAGSDNSPTAVMHRYWGHVNSGMSDLLRPMFADDASYEDVALHKQVYGGVEIADTVIDFFRKIPCQFEIENVVDDGREFAAQWICSGVHSAAVLGLPAATHKPFRFRGVSVGLIEDGRIKRKSDYWSLATMLEQIQPS